MHVPVKPPKEKNPNDADGGVSDAASVASDVDTDVALVWRRATHIGMNEEELAEYEQGPAANAQNSGDDNGSGAEEAGRTRKPDYSVD